MELPCECTATWLQPHQAHMQVVLMGSHSPPISIENAPLECIPYKFTDICYHTDNINSKKIFFFLNQAVIKDLTDYACNWCIQLL